MINPAHLANINSKFYKIPFGAGLRAFGIMTKEDPVQDIHSNMMKMTK